MTELKEEVAPTIGDDSEIESALADASIPVLLMSMIHMSGDLSILEGDERPAGIYINELQGFMSEEDKATVRSKALAVIKKFRDGGCQLPPPPDTSTIQRMMSFVVGEEVTDEYVTMLMEDLDLDSLQSGQAVADAGASSAGESPHKVVVIGGGMSGILLAVKLSQAGIPFVVVEKNPSVAGTWYENRYPGVRVDVSNHLYSYSFEPAHHWTEYFSQQPELLTYFENVVDKYDLERHFMLDAQVTGATFNEDENVWYIDVERGGSNEKLIATTLVSAVGQLNRPKIPDLPGLELFKGQWCHSAEWRDDIELADKKVVVVGAGASAFQLVPAIAEQTQSMTVFQRTPPWMFENPIYHEAVPEGLKWCLRNLPFYAKWYRFLLFWPSCDGAYDSVIVDPDWPHQSRSSSEVNDFIRILFTEYIEKQVGDNKELLSKVLPDYPPMARRTLQDNGSWLSALQREDVHLENQGIRAVTESGVIADDGQFHEADVIVYATGFQVDKFLWPMEIEGKGGKRLSDVWSEEPSAYLGITVSGFPNFYCMFGPGTNLAFGGSLIFNAECQARYILDCLDYLETSGGRSLEIKSEVHQDYQRRFREQHSKLIWELPSVESYYKNSKGEVTLLWPWKVIDMWKWTRNIEPEEYTIS